MFYLRLSDSIRVELQCSHSQGSLRSDDHFLNTKLRLIEQSGKGPETQVAVGSDPVPRLEE